MAAIRELTANERQQLPTFSAGLRGLRQRVKSGHIVYRNDPTLSQTCAQKPQVLERLPGGDGLRHIAGMNQTQSWLAEAGNRHDRGDLAGAEQFYLKVRQADPRIFEANHGLSLVRFRQGRIPEALELIGQALAIMPDNPEALCNRGNILRAAGQLGDALASYDHALVVRPRMMQALFNRGNALHDMGRFADAVADFDSALAQQPRLAQAWNNRGNALRELRRFEEALASYEQALALRRGHAPTLNNLALALFDLGRLRQALEISGQALAAAPHFAEALYIRGSILTDLNRPLEAMDCFERAVAADPDHPFALGALARIALVLCDWERTEKIAPLLKADIMAGRSAIQPFTLLGYWDDNALQARCAENYLRRVLPPRPERLWKVSPRRPGKIRLAYLSADFRNSAAAYLTAELFERHDRERFQVTAISFGPDDGSAMRARLMKAFDDFHDVRARSDREIAELIRSLDTDIAIDLMGYTQNSRPGILAHRPSPVQASFLGYPGPMSADFIDYVIGDAVVLPPDRQAYYAERIIRLPASYYPHDSSNAIAVETPSRSEAGLPEQGFIFCCFNNAWKITAPVFAVWMGLLAKIEGSVMWLLVPEPQARTNLLRRAAAHGIDPARLVFAPRMAPEHHLARHRLADLFLDTLPYNAHTTASDALWAGLPVITCMGESFAARVAASQLHAIGLPELVTEDLAGYEALALELANDPVRRKVLRHKLAQNRVATALFDAPGWRGQLEAAYIAMLADTAG